jgi:hypothetical protein
MHMCTPDPRYRASLFPGDLTGERDVFRRTIRATPVTRLTPGSHRSEEGGAVDGDR